MSACAAQIDIVWRPLVCIKYWTLNLGPLMVYPEVLFPPNFTIKVVQPLPHMCASEDCRLGPGSPSCS